MLKTSRIYRDARRLFGRGPYKDHLWFCVRTRDKDWTGRPTFTCRDRAGVLQLRHGLLAGSGGALMEHFAGICRRIRRNLRSWCGALKSRTFSPSMATATLAARGRSATACGPGFRKNPSLSATSCPWTRKFFIRSWRRKFWRISGCWCHLQVFCRTVRLGDPWASEGRNLIFIQKDKT